jgi:hypothetical protein
MVFFSIKNLYVQRSSFINEDEFISRDKVNKEYNKLRVYISNGKNM